MYHRHERTTEDSTTTEDSHVDFLNVIVDGITLRSVNISDTYIGFDVDDNPLSNFFLAVSRHIKCIYC